MDIQRNERQIMVLRGSSAFASALVLVIFVTLLVTSLYAGFTISHRAFIASILIGVSGVAVCWVLFHRTVVELDRRKNTVSVSKQMLHGMQSYDLSLSEVKQADVDMRRSQSNGTTYRLVLVARQGEGFERLIIGHGFSSDRKSLTTARLINDWLGVPEAGVGTGPTFEDVQTVATAFRRRLKSEP